MTITKIKAGNVVEDDAKVFDGWQVRIRVRPSQMPPPKTPYPPETTLVGDKRNFLKKRNQTRSDAMEWGLAREKERDEIDGNAAKGIATRAATFRRTLRDLAEHHFQDFDSFLSNSAITQTKIRGTIEEFLRWAVESGQPTYADQWTQTHAKAWRQYIRENHLSGGRSNPDNWVKRLFDLDLAREDGSAITKNPFTTRKLSKGEALAKKLLADPIAFTWLALVAIMEFSSPYVRLLWTMLYSTGVRSGELLGLTRERVFYTEGDHGTPSKIRVIGKTGPRMVPLNTDARNALAELLVLADDSGFVVRRDFTKGLKTPLLYTLNQVKKKAVEKYPQLRDELLGRFPVPEDEPKTVLRWVTRGGIRVQLRYETKGRFKTNVHSFRKTCATNLRRRCEHR